MKLIAIYTIMILLTGCVSLKGRFFDNVTKEINKLPYASQEVITEDDISRLPMPVQRYFQYCGFIGEEKMTNAFIVWDDVYLKMSPEKSWSKIQCYQFNVVPEPARFDYMKSHYLGLFPMEGSHMYHDQKGSMQIVLMKRFTVVDGKGMEFDQSELVTILSEILFVPSYALQPYISWEAINDTSAKATLTFNNKKVSGVFFFDTKGACVRFDTEDRYYDNHDGTYKRVKWSAVVDKYREYNCVKYISHIKAVWHTDKGDYEYFKGRIADIEFNVPTPDYTDYYR